MTTIETRGLSEKQAAVYTGVSGQYLRASRMTSRNSTSDAPPFVRIGSRIVYLKDDLDHWLESRRVNQSKGA